MGQRLDQGRVCGRLCKRVGRTGRAGKIGVASTLFGREQRTELLQLERTLGIRMERMQADCDFPVTQERSKITMDHVDAAPRSRMAKLPGEILQAHIEN